MTLKYAWPVAVVCVALLACVVLLVAAYPRPVPRDLPDLKLRDPRGQPFDLSSMNGRIWVASFVASPCLESCPDIFDVLAELYDGRPDNVRMATFVVGARGDWPRSPSVARERRGWVVCQGNSVDADDETAVRDLATASLGFSGEQLAGLLDGSIRALVAVVDERGRPRGGAGIVDAGSSATREAVAGLFGQLDFLVALNRRPSRFALISAASTLLLVAGVLSIRTGYRPAHIVCVGLATVATIVFLFMYLGYRGETASLPSRGWLRQLYSGVLLTHAALTALALPLIAAQYYFALRGQLDHHRAMARWSVPVWLYATTTGALIYQMLSVWLSGN